MEKVVQMMKHLMNRNEMIFDRVIMTPRDDSFIVGKKRHLQRLQEEREEQMKAQLQTEAQTTPKRKTQKPKKAHRRRN